MMGFLGRVGVLTFFVGGSLVACASHTQGVEDVGAKSSAVTSQDFANLRAKYYDFLTGGSTYSTSDPLLAAKLNSIHATADSLWSMLDTTPGRTSLFPDAPSSSLPGSIQTSYEHLRSMALALKTPCAPGQLALCRFGNMYLKADIISALDWLYANWYNPSVSAAGSGWYPWQIGAPLALTDTSILLYSDLTSTQVNNYLNAINSKIEQNSTCSSGWCAVVEKEGANRAWQAQVELLVGALKGGTIGDSYVSTARDGLSALFEYQTTQDGFFWDGSYVFHQYYAYAGAYGAAQYQTTLNMRYLLAGSPWPTTDLPAPACGQKCLVTWAFNTFQPLIYKGAMFDFERGRDIAATEESDHNAGGWIISSILLALDLATAPDAFTLKRQLKQWANDDPGYFSDAYTSVFSILRLEQIMNDGTIVLNGGQTVAKYFPMTSKAAVQRPGYGFGLSSFHVSPKTCTAGPVGVVGQSCNYESILGVNLQGWHQSDGMTLLYVGNDIDQYRNDYWSTVNTYRLPGTTVENNTQIGTTYNNDTWVGGASDGQYLVAGMKLNPHLDSTLVAQKSWFALDNEIVALGSNISSTSAKGVLTIVDNRKLNLAQGGNNAFVVNGVTEPTTLGWSQSINGVTWANLAGNVAGADLGYYFPTATTLNALRVAGSGTWNTQNSSYPAAAPCQANPTAANPPPTTCQNDFMTLWFDHGVNPTNATYAYVLLPGMNASQTQAYAASPQVTVLRNDSTVQAVFKSSLGLVEANFWTDATQSVNVGSTPSWLTVDKKASVIAQDHAESGVWYTNLYVSDPTQANTGTINVTLGYPVHSVVYTTPGVTVVQLSPKLMVSVNVNNSQGGTFKMRFAD